MVRHVVRIIKAIEIEREVKRKRERKRERERERERKREVGNRTTMTKIRNKLIIYNLSTFTIFCLTQYTITLILTHQTMLFNHFGLFFASNKFIINFNNNILIVMGQEVSNNQVSHKDAKPNI